MCFDTDFDERYFINLNGLSRTPLKLINSMSPHTKSPPYKNLAAAFNSIGAENDKNGSGNPNKRRKKGHSNSIDLSFGSSSANYSALGQ
jgi:hypothetical protein